jgi:hypothetical protein
MQLRASLLDELVEIFQKRRKVLEQCDDDLLNLAHKISTGRITSLKKLGGKSRGEKFDALGPKLKSEVKKEKEKEKAGKKGADAGGVLLPAGGTC